MPRRLCSSYDLRGVHARLAGRFQILDDRHDVALRVFEPCGPGSAARHNAVFILARQPVLLQGDPTSLQFGDLRFDRSDQESFMTEDGTGTQQVTVALNALGVL